MHYFTKYDPVTGEVNGNGAVMHAADVEKQSLAPGEALLPGVAGDRISDKVVLVGGKPQLTKRDAADIAARRVVPEPAADQTAVLLEALRAKGVVTDADIRQARDGLKARTPKSSGA